MKWYDSILTNAKRILGLEADATEAEVDQKLAETTSIDREAIRQEVEQEYLQEKNTEWNQAQEQLATTQEQLTTAQASITDLQQQLAEANATIAQLKDEPDGVTTEGAKEKANNKTPLYMQSPLTRKAMQMAGKA